MAKLISNYSRTIGIMIKEDGQLKQVPLPPYGVIEVDELGTDQINFLIKSGYVVVDEDIKKEKDTTAKRDSTRAAKKVTDNKATGPSNVKIEEGEE